MRLMIVEDNRTNLLVLRGILEKFPDCTVDAHLDPTVALRAALDEVYDLIIVDYMMPGIDGRSFIAQLRARPEYAHIPMVMITADGQRETRIEAITAGATDFLNKPVDPIELKARIGNLLTMRRQQKALAEHAEWLMHEVARATRHLIEREEEIIWRLSRALDYRDNDTGEHTTRVANVARMLAEELGLSVTDCRTLYLATPLHDIGKVAIPDAVLSKPGKLAPDERALMQTHVTIGNHILADGNSELVRMAASIAATHHERWDGTGYPNRLAGDAIPLEGRIAAIADVFDALVSDRPYKRAWSLDEARREIQAGAGSQFDPACVAAFERRWPQIIELYTPQPSPGLATVAA